MKPAPATPYRFHSIEADGPWTSPPFPSAERRHIEQGVVGGYIMGRPRWAEDLDGNFLYGLDAKGKELKTAPTYIPETAPRRRGKNKPATAAQLKRERSRERKERLDAALATTLETRRADPYNIASWETKPKTPAQLDAEIAEVLAAPRAHAKVSPAERAALSALVERYDNAVAAEKDPEFARRIVDAGVEMPDIPYGMLFGLEKDGFVKVRWPVGRGSRWVKPTTGGRAAAKR